jgi:murein DD-endopeptidase MepM/ murein hydrolase activator NlpD
MKKITPTLLILLSVGLLVTSSSVFGQAGALSKSAEIDNLNSQIASQKKQLDDLADKQKSYQAVIEQKRADQDSLNNQLAILDNQTAQLQVEIDSTNINIDKTGLEMKKIELDIANANENIEQEKEKIGNLLRLVYKQDQVSTMEMLLSNDSLADFLNQSKYLENTNDKLKDSLDDLKNNKDQLESNQQALADKNKQLADLKSQLQDKVGDLQYEQDSKNTLLEETKSSEAQYQSLLAEAKRQQLQAENEVSALEQAVREKMSSSDREKLENSSSVLAWPVPKNTITTYFHDPDYPYRKIIGEHPAIDIRAPQGSTLRAAADGYVARVKFDGTTNYAYIMIIHSNVLSTVYGHVSGVSVSVDQFVHQGDVIGRTGGAPHGIGSGPFTTGSHLHFEVRKDGIPVNPLNYLP